MKLKLAILLSMLLLMVSCGGDTAASSSSASSLSPAESQSQPVVSPQQLEEEQRLAALAEQQALAQQRALISQQLEPEIEEICRNYNVTGMSLAVFDENGVFYQQSYGFANVEQQIPASEDTIYRIASISKSVTALLALELTEEGSLSPEQPLPDLGGCEILNPNFPDKPITLRHLLTHTAGIFDSGSYWQAVGSPSIPPLKTFLYTCYGAEPGEQYCYSNLGMGLVSGVIETASGQRFLDYTREQIFEPMGIDAAYSYTQLEQKDRVADIYQNGERTVHMADWSNMSAKYTNLPLGQLYALGHGDLFITAKDLTRFARIMAGCPQDGEPVVLTGSTLQMMQTVQFSQELPEESYPNEIMRGLGTHITDQLVPDRRMVGHQGNAYGSICGMFFDPQQKNGFVLLTNGSSCQTDQAGLYLVNKETAQAVYSAFFGFTPATE